MNFKVLRSFLRREHRHSFVFAARNSDLSVWVGDGFAGFVLDWHEAVKALEGIIAPDALEPDTFNRYTLGSECKAVAGNAVDMFRTTVDKATEPLTLTNLAHYNDQYKTVGRFLQLADGRFVSVNQQYLECLADAKFPYTSYREFTFWGSDPNGAVIVKDKQGTLRAVIMPIVNNDLNGLVESAVQAATVGKAA